MRCNTLWADLISKGMKDVRPAFKRLDNGDIVPIGYQRVNCHTIFDVMMEDFRQKARLVVRGHVTDPPYTITYASVVSRETVIIALTLDALNDLPVKVAVIHNAYITSPVTETIWTFLGLELVEDSGRKAIVVYSLYFLKSAGAEFWYQLKDCMQHLGFFTYPDNLDLCMKPMVMTDDRFNYYAHVLIYVDDVMVIYHDAESVLRRIDKYFKLKQSLIGDPEIYFWTKLKKMRLDNGVWAWKTAQKDMSRNWWQHLRSIWPIWLMRVGSFQRRKTRTPL